MRIMTRHFLSYIEEQIKACAAMPAMTDVDTSVTVTYAQMGEQIERLRMLFTELGLKKGDKVALCGRNSSNWATTFLAVAAYEAVGVSILHDFHIDSVHSLVNHSEAKLFFVGDHIIKGVDPEKLPNVEAVVSLATFEPSFVRSEAAASVFKAWKETKIDFSAEKIQLPTTNLDDLVLINYTSGTTSEPKGVMLSNRNISSNIQFARERLHNEPGWTLVSILPMAHMFGMAFEYLFQLSSGCHVYFLSKTPSPQVLMKALADAKPYLVLTVPLVIEKIFKKSVFPKIQAFPLNILWRIPLVNRPIRKAIREKLLSVFGGRLRYLIIGGAALNREVDDCLNAIGFPYLVGYGMTECAPLIGYEDWQKYAKTSCGKIVDRMEVKIDSEDPAKIVGEIMVKGENVMSGYYKNPSATSAVLGTDGWLHTGDLGLIVDGNIYIKGRSKNMLLGPSGQNIYPEEVEDVINSQPYVVESVVVDRDSKLVALVFPDHDALKRDGLSDKAETVMAQNRERINKAMPAYSQIARIELVEQEFEKTPKRSIKRFLYK